MGVVFVLLVVVAFRSPDVPDPDPDKDADGVIVEPDWEPDEDADLVTDVLPVEEVSSPSEFWFWSCRGTIRASTLLSRNSGQGQAEEQATKKRRREERREKRPEPFISDVERGGFVCGRPWHFIQ
ncbi:hypothetical protein AYO21_04450 [Fonsecaea monophora]|uniref:Secreted protein n=1 Tax=Fonsecaea monophora TaxID=254056 RepID=A0A177FAI4_9EURO|nr:hypothetical protein AYO21_04450 [Fonsecaea monophora]OAG41287.1 hypothetical protein AYO21_04450 [Fonsecaea monophora]